MKEFDFRINTQLLSKFVGQEFVKYKCDEFIFTNSVSQFVELYIGDKVFSLENIQEPNDYFGYYTDVAIFKLVEKNSQIEQFEHEDQVNTCINKKIINIKIINENQKMYVKQKIAYNVWFTRAIILELENSEEICFEKDSLFFSEEIVINRGHNLVNVLEKPDQFMETMREEQDTEGEYYREEININ